MYLTDLELGCVASTWNPVVRRTLSDSPCLLHIVHLKIAEGDVPCVAEAATYGIACQLYYILYLLQARHHIPPPFGG